jgi:hypothetical protein
MYFTLLVIPGSNMKDELDDSPSHSIAACHKAVWIKKESLTRWFVDFVPFVKPSKDDPIILTLDVHYSHTRNFDVIYRVLQKNLTIFILK